MRPSLAGVLTLLLGADLLFRRLLSPLLQIDLLLPAGPLRTAIDQVGLFAFHAATLLGLVVALLGLGRLLFSSVSPIPRGMGRGALGALATPLLPIAAVGVWIPLGARLELYQQLCTLFVLLMILLAGWGAIESWRHRWGLLLFLLPLTLATVALAGFHLVGVEVASWVRVLLFVGEGTALAAGGISLCLLPRLDRTWFALAIGAIAFGGLLLCGRNELFATRMANALELLLPLATSVRLAGAAGLALGLGVTVALIVEPGPTRLRGYGLALVGLAGFQHQEAYQIAALLVGFLCLLESCRSAWRPGQLLVGEPTAEPAPLVLWRRGSPRLGRPTGEEVALGDAAFDTTFHTFDARHLTERDPILDDDIRPQLIAAVDGWLEIWPRCGVRYRAQRIADEQQLVELLNLLKQR